jgi:hypothetical protein
MSPDDFNQAPVGKEVYVYVYLAVMFFLPYLERAVS